jgi:hypothetical protein
MTPFARWCKHCGNAASLAAPLGGGMHGHIGLIMTAQLYATLTDIPYEAPGDPGALPIIPIGASAAARENTRVEHKEQLRIFDNHTNMDDALKSQIIDAVQETCTCKQCAASTPDMWAS